MKKAGIVAVVGKPNVGKSTLVNHLVGEHVCITSPKAQSTRTRVVGIVTRGDVQMVLHDTPGLITPHDVLHESMRAHSLAAIADADVILHLLDATERHHDTLVGEARLDRAPRGPVVTAFTKADLVSPERVQDLLGRHPGALALSAVSGSGFSDLERTLADGLPESPFLYPEDDVSAHPVRSIAAELVREAALAQLEEEVPHSVACVVEEFREAQRPVYIRAVISVERESQKRILIGGGGTRIRQIGRAARSSIESLVGDKVYLDLWVKVLHNWRRDRVALERLGLAPPRGDTGDHR
ncbi:MAG: GTPase Era [Gemmatimonadaceae bacterium]